MSEKIPMSYHEKYYFDPAINDYYTENFATLKDGKITVITSIDNAGFGFISSPGEEMKNALGNNVMSEILLWNNNMKPHINVPIAEVSEFSRVVEDLNDDSDTPEGELTDYSEFNFDDYIAEFIDAVNTCSTLSSVTLYAKQESVNGFDTNVTYIDVMEGTILYNLLVDGKIKNINTLCISDDGVVQESIFAMAYESLV